MAQPKATAPVLKSVLIVQYAILVSFRKRVLGMSHSTVHGSSYLCSSKKYGFKSPALTMAATVTGLSSLA